jgi:hypothetical protein
MLPALRSKDVERLALRIPVTECTRRWNALLVWQRHILTVVWPGGRVIHFANMPGHCCPYFRQHGNDPALEPGATLEIRDDDGSRKWADLHQRLQAGPIREQRG